MRFRRMSAFQASHPGMKKNINEADAKYIVAYCTGISNRLSVT